MRVKNSLLLFTIKGTKYQAFRLAYLIKKNNEDLFFLDSSGKKDTRVS